MAVPVTQLPLHLKLGTFFLQCAFRSQVASLIRHRYHTERRAVPVCGWPLVPALETDHWRTGNPKQHIGCMLNICLYSCVNFKQATAAAVLY